MKVIYDKDLSPLARLIMIYMLSEETDTIEASVEGISNIVGCSTKTVVKGIKELESSGYLEKQRRGLGKSNIYTIKKRGE